MFFASNDSPLLLFAPSDRRRWVVIGSGGGALAYGLLYAVSAASGTGNQTLNLLFAALGCSLGVALALWYGPIAGGSVALAALWFEVHSTLYTTTSFPSPALLATAPIVVAASLLLRPRRAALLSAASIAATWMIVWFSPIVQARGVDAQVVYWLTAQMVIAGALWVLVALGLAMVTKAFARVMDKERALAETIDKAQDGILVVSASDFVLVANPAAERLLGLTLSAQLDVTLTDLLKRASLAPPIDVPGGADSTGERPRAWTLVRTDGEQKDLEITWRPMDDGRRQIVLHDVSERVQAERARHELDAQLAHAQRLESIGQLAGGIAHDFNNILTIVGAAAEELRDEATDDRQIPLLDDITAAQERGAALTKQLLAFARKDTVQPIVIDLSNHVLGMRSLLQRVAGEQTRITCDVEATCRIFADVGQVEQALVNLVNNARDAMPEGGTCTLRVVRITDPDTTQWVRLSVRDDGAGMDEVTAEKAFEPFFTTKARGRGTGLGLASVHGMVMQAGGRAEIQSQPGLGTTVMLDFPFSDATVRIPERRQEPTSVRGGATVLLAEDDDGTRATVARILLRLGYTVLLAPDGQQAIRVAEEKIGSVDLLLTDVMMPGLRGPQLAARFRELMPEVPVLFMSGYPGDELSSLPGFRLETDFLAKPFTSSALARRVEAKLAPATEHR